MATRRTRPRPLIAPDRSGAVRSARKRHLRRSRLRLARVCRRQFGVFTLQQAIAAGVAASTVYANVERGIFVKLWRGVFAIAAAPDSREQRWIAAQLLLGRDAALSHQTAADLHGLDHRLSGDGVHLTVTVRRPAVRRGIVVHRSATLDADGVTTVGPLRVTSVTRTLCDLAAEVGEDRLRSLVAAAVRSGRTSADSLRAALTRRQRFPGRTALRRIVDELSPSSGSPAASSNRCSSASPRRQGSHRLR